jgi:hypothetical protein
MQAIGKRHRRYDEGAIGFPSRTFDRRLQPPNAAVPNRFSKIKVIAALQA